MLLLGEPLQCAHIEPVPDLVGLDKEVKVVVGVIIPAIEDVQVQVVVLFQDFLQVLVHMHALWLALAHLGLHGENLILVSARVALLRLYVSHDGLQDAIDVFFGRVSGLVYLFYYCQRINRLIRLLLLHFDFRSQILIGLRLIKILMWNLIKTLIEILIKILIEILIWVLV